MAEVPAVVGELCVVGESAGHFLGNSLRRTSQTSNFDPTMRPGGRSYRAPIATSSQVFVADALIALSVLHTEKYFRFQRHRPLRYVPLGDCPWSPESSGSPDLNDSFELVVACRRAIP
jgi:hypothetical protein